MGTVSKRQRSRRRLAAFSFLSNISLDGTHRDTKLGRYNLSLQTDASKFESDSNRDADSQPEDESIQFGGDGKENDIASTCDEKTQSTGSINPSPRERVQSFVSETKSKFLSQRKKPIHSFHERHAMSACSSTESLGLYTRHSSSPLHEQLEAKFSRSPKGFKKDRIVLVSSSSAPFAVFSHLPYRKTVVNGVSRADSKQDSSKRRQVSGSCRPLSSINDDSDPLDIFSLLGLPQPEEGQDVSYSFLLAPGGSGSNINRKHRTQEADYLIVPCAHINRCHSFDPSVSNVFCSNKPAGSPTHILDRSFDWTDAKFCHHSAVTHSSFSYTPNLLDDPQLVTGKHSTVITFSSYITSIIDYVKPSDLKKELNEKFRERFPHIHLTLSKLRSLKREMLKITRVECGIDLLTVAQAYVFFEKLILKALINKQNRKLCAAACVLLSAKLNDVKGQDLKNLIEKLECGFRLNHRDLIRSEFRVLVALEFSLHLPTWEVFPHYQRLLYES